MGVGSFKRATVTTDSLAFSLGSSYNSKAKLALGSS